MINYWKLNNGAQLIIEDIPYLRSAAIGVYIKTGSRNENETLSGASHFVEHMLFKGTSKRSAREIAEGFAAIGGQLNAFTSREHTCVYGRALDEDIGTAMDVVFDMLFDSQFNQKDFETEKEVVIEEINLYEDTPDELIHELYTRHFWSGHPMGMPILGTLDSIGALSRDELFQYYKKNYQPSNMIITVAGNIDLVKIKAGVEDILEKYPGKQIEDNKEKPAENMPFIYLRPKEIEQVQICMGIPGISYHHEGRYTQNVMNSILGGGMGSRLFQNLREELGLAYSVYSYPSNYSDTGIFNFYIGTSPGKVGQFFEALYKQLEGFMNEGVSQEEVTRTQKLIKSSIFLGLESVMNRMTRLAKSLLMYDKIVPPEEIIDKIYQVTPEMIKDFAANSFKPETFSLAAIGDQKALPLVNQEFSRWWGERRSTE